MKIYIFSLSIIVSFLASNNFANAMQANDDFMSAFESCKAIENESKRLKCFEGLKLNSGKKKTTTRPAVKAKKEAPNKTQEVPKTYEEKEQAFGGSNLKKNLEKKKAQELDEMTTSLLEVQKSQYGRSTFFLGNGQVWQQTSHDNLKPIRAKKYNDVNITIKRKIFGSHSLYYRGLAVKVRRLK
jgi:hypothetical protein